jgi:protocatechuate 3,4-dioxygenase beta subunit
MVLEGEPGEPMLVSGRVLDSAGRALAGVHILAYQTDRDGYYSPNGADEANARLCAVVRTNESGEYSLETVRPGSYPTGGVPAHIHFELWSDAFERKRRELRFADDESVSESRKLSLTRTSTVRPVTRDPNGRWRVERDFTLP